MILVTLGTQDKSFVRLLKEVDRLISIGEIQDEVIVQAGYTKYQSNNMQIFDMLDMEEFSKILSKVSLVISHGGVGSVLGAINNNKKVIAIPRQKKYKEHVNDHQRDLINNFDKMGLIIGCQDVSDLSEALKKVDAFKPQKYISNRDNMVKLIEDLIDGK